MSASHSFFTLLSELKKYPRVPVPSKEGSTEPLNKEEESIAKKTHVGGASGM
jgi:hypothetical protein